LEESKEITLYKDVSSTDWHANYFRFARKYNLFELPIDRNIKPNEFLSKGDLINLIYKVNKLKTKSEFGRASFYKTPREIKSPNADSTYLFTAAHRTLPFGTKVKATNLRNGLSVIVEIRDRGPFIDGTIIDLSQSAFAEIASLSTGIIPIELELIN